MDEMECAKQQFKCSVNSHSTSTKPINAVAFLRKMKDEGLTELEESGVEEVLLRTELQEMGLPAAAATVSEHVFLYFSKRLVDAVIQGAVV